MGGGGGGGGGGGRLTPLDCGSHSRSPNYKLRTHRTCKECCYSTLRGMSELPFVPVYSLVSQHAYAYELVMEIEERRIQEWGSFEPIPRDNSLVNMRRIQELGTSLLVNLL